jgi:MFS family permease
MTWGLSSIGVAYLAIGAASTLPHLIGARLLSGLGVSALVAGAMTAVADISSQHRTPPNPRTPAAPRCALG